MIKKTSVMRAAVTVAAATCLIAFRITNDNAQLVRWPLLSWVYQSSWYTRGTTDEGIVDVITDVTDDVS